MAMILVTGSCRESSAPSGPSITVQLPPAKPYAPQPAFSFGSNPRTDSEEVPSR